jgi:hypothetical protein
LFGTAALVPGIELHMSHGEEHSLTALPALHWTATPALALSLGVSRDLRDEAGNLTFVGTFSVEF